MNNYNYLKRDTRDKFYVDSDGDDFGVFGTESGFCYALYSDRDEAQQETKRRTVNRNS